MLMFHESARGKNYTGLTHRYQPQIDLSEHIRLGQAVLVGRAKYPVVNLISAYPSDAGIIFRHPQKFSFYSGLVDARGQNNRDLVPHNPPRHHKPASK